MSLTRRSRRVCRLLVASSCLALACSPAKVGGPERGLLTGADEASSGESVLTAANGARSGDAARSSPVGEGDHDEPPEEPALPKGTVVLHVGDSFAGSLGVPLGRRLKAAGLRYVLEYRDASYIPNWASGPELSDYVARHHPDLVVVTLGANEFELSAPETRANAVRRLVRRFEGRPCVWVTPPRWKPDSGILEVIHRNLKPCRYLDSDTIVSGLGRKKDGIHPNDEGRELWAEAVLTWLIRERQTGAERPWQFREE